MEPDFEHDKIENWKFGQFYYNKNDFRFIVKKRNKALGWTINFAHPKAIIGLIIIIILILAIPFFNL